MWVSGIFFSLCCLFLAVTARDGTTRMAFRAQLARSYEFPFEVSIQVWHQHTCGGALISRTHVLTAAHCLTPAFEKPFEKHAKFMTVEVGTTKIGQGKTHEIKRLAYKHDYDGNLRSSFILPNDIGIITLKTPVIESNHVRTISLPPPGYELHSGALVSIAGWGTAQLGGKTSQVLQKSVFYVMSHDTCKDWYKTTKGTTLVASQICCNYGYGFGICSGDSGSPLVYGNLIVGITSSVTGDGCGVGNPDVYTKVSSYIPFIRNEMNYDFTSGNTHQDAIAMNIVDNVEPSYNPQAVQQVQQVQQIQPIQQATHIVFPQTFGFYFRQGFPPYQY